MATSKDLVVQQGKTFSLTLRWEVPPIIYKPISAITKTAPIRITAVGHGLVNGWRCAVTDVVGMTDINPPMGVVRDASRHQATVVDADTIELNAVNAASFKPYISGGYVQYNTPVNLAGMTGRMEIKDKVGGTVLLSLTTENGGIAIDNTKKTITLKISAAATALLAWRTGVYDLEMVSSDTDPVVTALMSGKVSVTQEVTT